MPLVHIYTAYNLSKSNLNTAHTILSLLKPIMMEPWCIADEHINTFINERKLKPTLHWACDYLSMLVLKLNHSISAETCGLDDVFLPDDLCSRQETLLIYIDLYTYQFFIRVLVIGHIYIYIYMPVLK